MKIFFIAVPVFPNNRKRPILAKINKNRGEAVNNYTPASIHLKEHTNS